MIAFLAGIALGYCICAWLRYNERKTNLEYIERLQAEMFRMASEIGHWEDTHTNPLTRQLVKLILENADRFQWTLQGFGLFRLYLGKIGRLHVWDDRFKYADVSEIHDHAWPLRSRIIAGKLTNKKFSVKDTTNNPTHLCVRIRTGEGGGPVADPIPVELVEESAFEYGPGDDYQQKPDEIHWTIPEPGTVTLMARPEDIAPEKIARVFHPYGTPWGTAEPRRATPEEVSAMSRLALTRLT